MQFDGIALRQCTIDHAPTLALIGAATFLEAFAGKLDGATLVNAESLVKSGALRRSRDGVRLLGRGEIKAKVNFEVFGASKSAVEAVEKAGGSVKILAPKRDEGEKAA